MNQLKKERKVGVRSTKNITRQVAQQAILSNVMSATDSQLEGMLLEIADDFSNFHIVSEITEEEKENDPYRNITDICNFPYKDRY